MLSESPAPRGSLGQSPLRDDYRENSIYGQKSTVFHKYLTIMRLFSLNRTKQNFEVSITSTKQRWRKSLFLPETVLPLSPLGVSVGFLYLYPRIPDSTKYSVI